MRSDKKALILETIILEYIRRPSPVGSEYLKSQSLSHISSATIRKYFKELLDEGLLLQFHASGGRVPTHSALGEYWRRVLQSIPYVPIATWDHLVEVGSVCDVSIVGHTVQPNRLLDVVEVDTRMVLVVFEEGVVTLGYDSMLSLFLTQLKGQTIEEIKAVAMLYNVPGLEELFQCATMTQQVQAFQKPFFQLAVETPSWGDWFMNHYLTKEVQGLDYGVYTDTIVPQGGLVFKLPAVIEGSQGWVMGIGDVAQNYHQFLTLLQGEAA